jgi:hypothetical protein
MFYFIFIGNSRIFLQLMWRPPKELYREHHRVKSEIKRTALSIVRSEVQLICSAFCRTGYSALGVLWVPLGRTFSLFSFSVFFSVSFPVM